jgi:hypothetical protein
VSCPSFTTTSSLGVLKSEPATQQPPTNSVYYFSVWLTPDRACSQRSPFGAHARAYPTRRPCRPGAFFVPVFSFEPLTYDTRRLAVRIPRLSAWRFPNSPKGISQRRILLLPCLLKRAGDSIDPSALRHFLCALQQRVVFAQRLEVVTPPRTANRRAAELGDSLGSLGAF